MITNISIENFKSLQKIEALPLSNINLFTGINGVGKSSLLQIILLFRQTFLEKKHDKKLLINGQLISLGMAEDVFCEYGEIHNGLVFQFQTEKETYNFFYKYKGKEEEPHFDLATGELKGSSFWKEPIFGEKFYYISADRIGPKRFYINSSVAEQSNSMGMQGQFALQKLNELIAQKYKVNSLLAHPDTYNKNKGYDYDVAIQLSAWLGEISPNVKLTSKKNEALGITEAAFSFGMKGETKTRGYAPINVGFGLSYTLPVVLALLTATDKTVLLIENPEAHLHPQGQTKLAELMARAADCGAQLFVETHSDHIYYGLRIAVKEGFIEAEKAKVIFFHREEDKYTTNYEIVKIHEDGSITNNPDGFFDQYRLNLINLI